MVPNSSQKSAFHLEATQFREDYFIMKTINPHPIKSEPSPSECSLFEERLEKGRADISPSI